MNLATLLRRAAADHAERVALRLDDVEIDYADLAHRAARFAGHLRATGIGEGDRVAVLAPNCLEYLIAILGTWQAGAVGVPLNYMFPDAPLRHAVTDSGARLVVTPPGDVERLEKALDGTAPEVLTTGGDGSFAAAVSGADPLDGVVPRLDGDDALLMYTSGSTGVPKGVRQTHRNIAAQVDGAIEVYELTGDDHVLNCMPMFHVGGLQLASLPILMRGGQITFMPRWDVVRWLELVEQLRPTYGGLISTMMIDVGNRTVENPVVLDSFRVCMFGGSRTPSAAIERLEAGTGILGTEIYGQTEQSGLVVTYGPDETRRPDSMGRPLSQIVRTRLVPVDGSADLEPGDPGVGELWVRGDAVTPGYWGIDASEKFPVSEDGTGWFRTGDLMSRDADGYLYYVDRIDDMIVSGGENVFPQMVEEHLAGHPDLAEVAVIGTAHERWVEQVTAVVVPRTAITVEELHRWCAEHPDLQGMHRPRRIEIVDALPRTGSGKLNRPDLRRMFP
ncbi:class I adenylate-forming enzyme family protein [Actinomycetospora termitidis]|uniref:Class I adenylate-forming enzyme family protein n=1 Tax=Actinomycetospora termitidis TaxID=3053470 RepID=A0ABT7MHL0_9PSEU|nr:class I adenylate-forming enzyme family protein [Actinomycetospora sp. Odt1-22]MDL5160155.1 class I adenylate-forming enzyme family protein [Actinomycetospora sp. Odt1-22]